MDWSSSTIQIGFISFGEKSSCGSVCARRNGQASKRDADAIMLAPMRVVIASWHHFPV
jgi:hypothetical protein